jgi:hypothetical protein
MSASPLTDSMARWKRSEEDVLESIVELARAPDEVSFTFVVGAGFSYGLAPTTEQQVQTCIPMFLAKRFDRVRGYADWRDSDEMQDESRRCWRRLSQGHLKLDPATGMPLDSVQAYQWVFDTECCHGLKTRDQARRYHREILRSDGLQINPSHLFLGSLLSSSQKGSNVASRTPLSRLVLTTNFDPFLQTALQLQRQHYYMSDRPDVPDDLDLEFPGEAVHLVYVHGSIHQRFQATTPVHLKTLVENNKRKLIPVLKNSNVIVLGYSGWQDAISEALVECELQHQLFWLGLESDPITQDPVRDGNRAKILSRRDIPVSYAQVQSADAFMEKLYRGLRANLPAVVHDPIQPVIAQLETLTVTRTDVPEHGRQGFGRLVSEVSGARTFGSEIAETLSKLKAIRARYWQDGASVPGDGPPAGDVPGGQGPLLPGGSDGPSGHGVGGSPPPPQSPWGAIEPDLARAEILGDHTSVLELTAPLLERDDVPPSVVNALRLRRGAAYWQLGQEDAALNEWHAAPIEGLEGNPRLGAGIALRGMVFRLRGERSRAREEAERFARVNANDPTRVIQTLAESSGQLAGHGAAALNSATAAVHAQLHGATTEVLKRADTAAKVAAEAAFNLFKPLKLWP